MDTCVTSGHSRLPIRRPRGAEAFSLVEVALAIGIVAFAFVALLGMLPVGLNTFRQAVDASVGAQITQHVVNDAQQTDFNTLTQGITTAGTPVSLPERYFDNEGNEIPPAGPITGLSTADQARVFYSVITSVNLAAVPGDTYLTDGTGTGTLAGRSNLAVVTLKIMNVTQPNTPLLASGLVSRNQPAQ